MQTKQYHGQNYYEVSADMGCREIGIFADHIVANPDKYVPYRKDIVRAIADLIEAIGMIKRCQ